MTLLDRNIGKEEVVMDQLHVLSIWKRLQKGYYKSENPF